MITYGGVGLLVAADAVAWVEKTVMARDILDFDYSYIDDELQPHHDWTYTPRLNCLYWPRGASRWAVGHFLIDDERLTKLRPKVYAGPEAEKYKPLDLVMGERDITKRVTAEMYMLPPRPVSERGNGLWLLTLVDERYFWRQKSATIAVTAGTTTWAQLYSAIGTALGVTITADAVHASYLKPSGDMAVQYKSLPQLLDIAAYSTGQRIVRRLDGTVRAESYDTAADRFDLNIDLGNQKTGGRFRFHYGETHDLRSLAPSTLAVIFPRSDDGVLTDDFRQVAVTLTSLGLTEYTGIAGHPHAATARTNCIAAYVSGSPTNNAEVTALANRIATDWYRWLLADRDVDYNSIIPWVPEGMHDHVLWKCIHGDVETRVVRPAWNERIPLLRHYGTSGAFDAPVGGQPAVQGGDSVFGSVFADSLFVGGEEITSSGTGASVLVASTANVTPSGSATIDGVSLVTGDYVLLWQQTDPTENGLWVADTGGAWTQVTPLTSGMLVSVTSGSTYGASVFVLVTPDPIVVGTDPTTWTKTGGGSDDVLLATISLTGAALQDIIFSDYDPYGDFLDIIIRGRGVKVTNDDTDIWLRTSTDGGSTYDAGASDYAWTYHLTANDGASSVGEYADDADAAIVLVKYLGTASGEYANFDAVVKDPSLANYCDVAVEYFAVDFNGTPTRATGGGHRLSQADVDAVRIMTDDGGNFTAGTIYVFGRRRTAGQSIGSHPLLSHSDATYSAPTVGAIVIGVAGPSWSKLAVGTSGQFPQSNGTTLVYVSMSGDATIASGGALTIAANAVSNTKLADMAAWTIKARNNAASGDPQDVAVGDLTEEASPTTGHYIIGYVAGALRKFDVGNLPSGGADNLGNHTATEALKMAGFTVYGNSTSGGTLTLESTSHGTKGGVALGGSDWLIFPGITAPSAPGSGVAEYTTTTLKQLIQKSSEGRVLPSGQYWLVEAKSADFNAVVGNRYDVSLAGGDVVCTLPSPNTEATAGEGTTVRCYITDAGSGNQLSFSGTFVSGLDGVILQEAGEFIELSVQQGNSAWCVTGRHQYRHGSNQLGGDYTLTNAYADVDSTNFKYAMVERGTYRFWCNLRVELQADAVMSALVQLYNQTDTAAVSGSERYVGETPANVAYKQGVGFEWRCSFAAAKEIRVQAKYVTAGTVTTKLIEADHSWFGWERIGPQQS